MVHVDSEAMTDVKYDSAARVLRVCFADGGWYRYFGVPPSVHQALLVAESQGRFFHDHIRDRYPYERC